MDQEAFLQRRGKTDEISLALQLTQELNSTVSLHHLLTDTLPKVSQGQIPPADQLTKLNNDAKMTDFAKKVMLCTKKDYSEQTLTSLSQQPYTLSFTANYPRIIDQNIKEIMSAGQTHHLQAVGHELTKGEGQADLGDDEGAGYYQFSMRYINLNKTELITRRWEQVYHLVGDNVFKYIHKEFLIFVKYKQDSYVQLSGDNIFEYVKAQTKADELAQEAAEQADSKLKAKKQLKYNIPVVSAKPTYTNENTVDRNRIFYCAHMNRNFKFFKAHKLSKIGDSEQEIKGLSTDVFGETRVRSSLKEKLQKLLRCVVSQHKQFDFPYYLNKCAPLPTNWTQRKKDLREISKRPLLRPAVYRELFENCHTTNLEVTELILSYLNQVLPRNFLHGTKKNEKVFRKKVKQFVEFNRFETYTKQFLLAGFEVDKVEWLRYNSNHKNSAYFQRENQFVFYRLLKWVFEELIVTLVRCYFYATEKQKEYSKIFYYRKEIWNFLMKLSTQDLLVDNLEKVAKKELRQKCEVHNFSPAKLRLVPKVDTFRPIMTFNRKLPQNKHLTTNRKLSTAHMVLKNLKQKMCQAKVGYAVFSYEDIMMRYQEFKKKWVEQDKPELYFVSLDIQKCYDSVNVQKLREMLHKTDLLEKDYYLMSCLMLKRKNNILGEVAGSKKGAAEKDNFKQHFRHKYQKICVDGRQYPSLIEIMDENYFDYNFKRAICIEAESRKKVFKHEILNPIDYIIQNNYVTFNKKCFKQTKGIPQGMCISYILSSFYYSCLEESALQFIKTSNALNCIMRLTDDYLLMTSSKSNALLFIERLFTLATENGFAFNAKKLKTNFNFNIEKLTRATSAAQARMKPGEYVKAAPVPAQQQKDDAEYKCDVFQWIGISIDTKTLGLVPNIQVTRDQILCSLNINVASKDSILWLKRKLKSFLMNNVSFYFSKDTSSKQFAKQTLEKIYHMASEKYAACCKVLKQFHCNHKCNQEWLKRLDLRLAQTVYVVIHSFFKYLLCNIQGGSIFEKEDYEWFFKFSLKFFLDRFATERNYFGIIHKVMKAKYNKSDFSEPLEDVQMKN